jgi:hypothetical protein
VVLILIFMDEMTAALPALTIVFIKPPHIMQGFHCSRGLSATIEFWKVGVLNLTLT